MRTTRMRAALALVALTTSVAANAASEEELNARLEALSHEMEALRAEVRELKSAAASAPAPTSPAGQNAPVASAGSSMNAPYSPRATAGAEPSTTLFGYGELNYNHPRNSTADAQADVRRAVIGIEHSFNDRTRVAGEFEFEHAVTSADDQGETEVEQLYVEHRLTDVLAAQGGLFLIPAGLLNRNHEPTAYYGVERNFVETNIIPTTWRELGLQLGGHHDSGINWSFGATTGFDLSKWNAYDAEGRESPLASVHQEGQLAKAGNLAGFVSVEYQGIPDLLIGASLFSGKAGQRKANSDSGNVVDARVTLWDAHTRWTPGRWDLSALYARGTIRGAGGFNSTLAAVNADGASLVAPIPRSFWGGYVQVAYQIWTSGDYSLSPFVRYERFNTAASYDGLDPALGISPADTERVITGGASFRITPSVVVKADYQKFQTDTAKDRWNLGLGYQF